MFTFMYSQARSSLRVFQDIHNSSNPYGSDPSHLSRETTDRSKIGGKSPAFTMAYETKFDLFHADTRLKPASIEIKRRLKHFSPL
ncbi:hypothetical protein PUN4_500018 [Paraburkholderia unamae]|nr:hypothetical protein PUN4_500018 [Paraburkholderia unamae]